MFSNLQETSILHAELKTVLFKLSQCSLAAVSGGYLRDTILGTAPKDIDIFCTEMPQAQLQVFKKYFPDATLEPYSAWLDYSTTEVLRVWDLGDYRDLPLQLIELRPGLYPAERYRTNDFGICQLYDDGQSFKFTRAAMDDVRNREFTLSHCENQREFDRSMKRWARLAQKYPDYSLVIPDQFRKYQREFTTG